MDVCCYSTQRSRPPSKRHARDVWCALMRLGFEAHAKRVATDNGVQLQQESLTRDPRLQSEGQTPDIHFSASSRPMAQSESLGSACPSQQLLLVPK